ncbi:MAG: MarR family winged helix-turn-helix transcriptional regulator [Microthrixaceae bacterium]
MTSRPVLDRKFLAAVERLGRAVRVARQEVATTHGVSLLGLSVIERLADADALRVGQLAAELAVTQPTTSDAVAALVDKGLVRRSPDPLDGRAKVLWLSPAGRDLAERVAHQLAPLMEPERATSADDQARALRVVLEEIHRLQQAGVITVNRSCPSCAHFQPPAGADLARCRLLDLALPERDLRVDCPEHSAPAASYSRQSSQLR